MCWGLRWGLLRVCHGSAKVCYDGSAECLLSVCDGFAMVLQGCAEGFLGVCESCVKKDFFNDLLRVCFKFFYGSAVALQVVC